MVADGWETCNQSREHNWNSPAKSDSSFQDIDILSNQSYLFNAEANCYFPYKKDNLSVWKWKIVIVRKGQWFMVCVESESLTVDRTQCAQIQSHFGCLLDVSLSSLANEVINNESNRQLSSDCAALLCVAPLWCKKSSFSIEILSWPLYIMSAEIELTIFTKQSLPFFIKQQILLWMCVVRQIFCTPSPLATFVHAVRW